MINLEETLDILKEMKAIEWKQVTYDREEKDIKDPANGMPFIKKMIFPATLAAVYVCCRLLGSGILFSVLVLIIVAAIWRTVAKRLHLRKEEVIEKLEDLAYRRADLARQYADLDDMLSESVVPREFLSVSYVEKLILYMESGEADTLKEALSCLKIDLMKERIASQERKMEALKEELKETKKAAARAQKDAEAASSAARSASTMATLSRLSKK